VVRRIHYLALAQIYYIRALSTSRHFDLLRIERHQQQILWKTYKVRPGKAPLRYILQAEVAGEHIKKKPVDNMD